MTAVGLVRDAEDPGREVRQLRGPREASALAVGEFGILPDYCSLFLDVHGSTAHLQEPGDYEIQRTVGELLQGTRRLVEIMGGSLVEIQGDGALALFGGRDRFDRAVAAASMIQNLAVTSVAEDFRRRTGRSFEIGVGLARGDVTALCVHADRGISWLCLCTNTAAKLAKRTPAGHIYVAHEIFQALTRSESDLSVRWKTVSRKVLVGSASSEVRVAAVAPDVRARPPAAIALVGRSQSARKGGDGN